ncbi:UNVERIFIED_CONTAM: Ferredoxin--nitrite reductase, chloroplastic [Sesamum radiatum]|uniref:Ferredoxin--nitrite reductase, chloroplastic n=1 Tax=Sesamum radiatum TaxID=300843 RepID=A0AAW2RVI1_SESRA
MSSLSVKFLAPSLPNSSNRFKSVRLQATPPQTVAAPASGAAGVDAERLEPRVEEKDGYFVLKEKFRQGINPQEKVKIEKEPMKLFMENGIEELAKMSLEEIEKSKVSKDDIDVRLKWLGLFHRRKHQCKFQA